LRFALCEVVLASFGGGLKKSLSMRDESYEEEGMSKV
jgi:hypothetical protein